jgi:hypothetical protein
MIVVFDFERFNILGKDVFLPTTSPPLGETRERELALKITFSTACYAAFGKGERSWRLRFRIVPQHKIE